LRWKLRYNEGLHELLDGLDIVKYTKFKTLKWSGHVVQMDNTRTPKKYMIYLLTAIWLSPGGSSTVHIYTQTIHRTTQNKEYIFFLGSNLGEYGPCPILARFTLAFALQLRKKHGKTSVRVAASNNT